jgi:hypothetical protein
MGVTGARTIVVCITSARHLLINVRHELLAKGKKAVTDPTDINTRWYKRTGLTSNAIFQLWKAALKDDERLLDEAIASVHEQMISLDPVRAEHVIGLIIRRHRDAKEAFKAMLVAIGTRNRPPPETLLL